MRLLVLLALVACHAKKGAPAYAPDDLGGYGPGYGGGGYAGAPVMEEMADEREARRPAAKDAPMAPPPPPPPPPAVADATIAEPPGEPAPAPPEAAPSERMVHYDGWAQLRVADPPLLLDEVAALAEGAGGRTERMHGNTISVRVPVAKFEEVWAAVLALGDVTNRSVRADDVTEQFLAVDLRARTLRATRDRLIELLARAQDEEEKLALLQEITRVTEQLDSIEAQLRTLSDLAAMSRITVEAVPREAFSGSGGLPELAGFDWIRGLSPFNRYPYGDDKRVELPVPDGLVALAPRGPFAAESADGVVLWTMRVPNDPVGDATYWVDAIEHRVAEEFASPERKAVGGWACVVLREPGADEPYTWQVCVQPDGRWLEVAQAYFPGPAQVERYGRAIDAALSGGGAS